MADPTPGPTPTDDPGLQPERTGLAWTRTLVAFAACVALVAAHTLHQGAPIITAAVIGAVAVVLLALSSWAAQLRARGANASMARAVSPAIPRLVLLISAGVVVLSIVALAFVLTRG